MEEEEETCTLYLGGGEGELNKLGKKPFSVQFQLGKV